MYVYEGHGRTVNHIKGGSAKYHYYVNILSSFHWYAMGSKTGGKSAPI